MIDKSELQKTWKGVFDNYTIYSIYKLMNKGFIKELLAVVKEGKESRVLIGKNQNNFIAIKIYAVQAANFQKMGPYILGDKRFKRIKKTRRSFINAWCKKEFKNLERSSKVLNCPKPIKFFNNILIMKFIGRDMISAPRLINSKMKNSEKTFKKIILMMKDLYKKAKLVHADLSEYNILYWNHKPHFIDFSQAVLIEHPNADHFLKRDIYNICKYFKKLGVESDQEKIYHEITS